MLKKVLLSAATLMSFASSVHAANVVSINFYDMNTYAPIASMQGVSFSVIGRREGTSGTPIVVPESGLSNSVTGDYPTGEILKVDFNGLANQVSFRFHNENYYDYGPNTTVSAFGANQNLLGTMSLRYEHGESLIALSYSDIKELQFNNNKKTGSWIFGLSSLNATVTAVPEPESYAMLLAGLGMVGFMARRRKVA